MIRDNWSFHHNALCTGIHRPGKPHALHRELQCQSLDFIDALVVQHYNLSPHSGTQTPAKSNKTFWHFRLWPPVLSIFAILLQTFFNAQKPQEHPAGKRHIYYHETRSPKRSSGVDSSLPWPYRWWRHTLVCSTTASSEETHQAVEKLQCSHMMLPGKAPHAKECHWEAVFTCSSKTSAQIQGTKHSGRYVATLHSFVLQRKRHLKGLQKWLTPAVIWTLHPWTKTYGLVGSSWWWWHVLFWDYMLVAQSHCEMAAQKKGHWSRIILWAEDRCLHFYQPKETNMQSVMPQTHISLDIFSVIIQLCPEAILQVLKGHIQTRG